MINLALPRMAWRHGYASMDRQVIHARLRKLARKEKWRRFFGRRKAFGVAGHEYALNPPLAASIVQAFENQHGITLPEDYRQFITEIGNGGAGPAYGLFPFGQHDDGVALQSWEDGHLVGDFGKPFPHVEAWNLDKSFWDKQPNLPEGISVEEEIRLWEEWDTTMTTHYWSPSLMNGAIPICNVGCGLRQWLVINGCQRGFVWDDLRADDAGLAPATNAEGHQKTFADWYLAWLSEAEG